MPIGTQQIKNVGGLCLHLIEYQFFLVINDVPFIILHSDSEIEIGIGLVFDLQHKTDISPFLLTVDKLQGQRNGGSQIEGSRQPLKDSLINPVLINLDVKFSLSSCCGMDFELRVLGEILNILILIISLDHISLLLS